MWAYSKMMLVLVLVMSFHSAKADSPLTSTDIAEAYLTEGIVLEGMDCKGVITPTLCRKLGASDLSIALKIATINAVGWSTDVKAKNAEMFLAMNQGSFGFSTVEEMMEQGTADQLICYAYLLAMQDYNDVEEAMNIASLAVERAPTSLTIAMTHGLIKAQYVFDSDWCLVYQSTNEVRLNRNSFNDDLSQQALDIIFAYMDLYADGCD